MSYRYGEAITDDVHRDVKPPRQHVDAEVRRRASTVCKHLDRDGADDDPGWQCKAFPTAIPKAILDSWPTVHTEPYPGDNGTMFERDPPFPSLPPFPAPPRVPTSRSAPGLEVDALPGPARRIAHVSTAPRPAAPRRDRASLRAEVDRRKAARDARDLEILEQRRKEDDGQPMLGLEDLRKRLGLG